MNMSIIQIVHTEQYSNQIIVYIFTSTKER